MLKYTRTIIRKHQIDMSIKSHTDDPRQAIRGLYRDWSGFDELPTTEETLIKKSRSSSIYGEIMPTATQHLLNYLNLTAADVLYDLGSGIGKFVIQAAMTLTIRKIVGIELARSRHEIAIEQLKRAKKIGLIRTQPVQFFCKDMLKTNMTDATAIYCCSTAFPPSFMYQLAIYLAQCRKGLIFVSLQSIGDDSHFDQIDTLRLDTNWQRKAKVLVYQLQRPQPG